LGGTTGTILGAIFVCFLFFDEAEFGAGEGSALSAAAPVKLAKTAMHKMVRIILN
jgi:hypothetical protein